MAPPSSWLLLGDEGQRRLRRLVGSLLIHAALSALLFIVLLPLLWMLLTAFKQRGQGVNLRVIPATTVRLEAEAIPLPRPGERYAPVTFELADPDREWSRVTVAAEFNGWSPDASPMIRIGGVWARTFADVPAGEWPYKFVANGDQWMADPANEHTDSDGNSVIAVGDEPTSNLAMADQRLTDASRIDGDRLVIDYAAPEIKGLVAEVRTGADEWTEVPLTLENGRWRGAQELTLTGEAKALTLSRRYRHEISLAKAWHHTYTLGNFRTILTHPNYPFGQFFANSLVVGSGCAFLTVLLCLLAGYAFAVKQFWGRDKIFWALFASMLIPGLVFVLPQFAIINHLGWRDSYQAMILPHVANVFGLFLMRQYIRTLPGDLFSAAQVDGAGEFQVMRTIVVPLTLPILVTLFLLTFMAQWSNFLWQLIVNSPDSAYRTLPVGLALFRGQHDIDWELMMAGACFSVVPIAILFIFAQRHFIQGLTAGSVKG